MPENKLILNLTAEQQKQIKDATGESVSQLTIGFRAASSDLSEQDLNEVVGGVGLGLRKSGGDPTLPGSIYLRFG